MNEMTYISRDGRPAGWPEAPAAAGGKQGGAEGAGAEGSAAGYAEVESAVARADFTQPAEAGTDGRTRVFGNPEDLANARKYMRPDRYVFVDSTTTGELPWEGDIVLGKAPSRPGAMRIAGETAAETEKAIWDTMVSLGANWGDGYGSLSALYITGDIPELHRTPEMEEGLTAYPGNVRYTPEEWLEQLNTLKMTSVRAESSILKAMTVYRKKDHIRNG